MDQIKLNEYIDQLRSKSAYEKSKAIMALEDFSKTAPLPSTALAIIEEISEYDEQEHIRNGALEILKNQRKVSAAEKTKNMVVTTADVHRNYKIIGPVYFSVSNKGMFSSQIDDFKKEYTQEIAQLAEYAQISPFRKDWGFLYGEFSVGQNDFDVAFYISVQEIKKRAAMLGADAIVGMRQDIDIDSNGFQFFYLQMYGTAVKYIE